MNAIKAILLATTLMIVALQALGAYLDAEAKEASAARYAQAAQERDAALASACAKGQTGIVLYYKGKHCGK